MLIGKVNNILTKRGNPKLYREYTGATTGKSKNSRETKNLPPVKIKALENTPDQSYNGSIPLIDKPSPRNKRVNEREFQLGMGKAIIVKNDPVSCL